MVAHTKYFFSIIFLFLPKLGDTMLEENFQSYIEANIGVGREVEKKSLWATSIDVIRENMGPNAPITPTSVYGVLFNMMEGLAHEIVKLDSSLETQRSGVNIKNRKQMVDNSFNAMNIILESSNDVQEGRHDILLKRLVASFHLMKLVLTKVPDAVVLQTFDTFASLLYKVLDGNAHIDVSLPAVQILGSLMSKQKSNSDTFQQMLHILLQSCVDIKPRLRKKSVVVIKNLFVQFSSNPAIFLVLADSISSYVESVINEHAQSNSKEIHFVLEIIKNIIPVVPYKFQKEWCLLTLRLPTLISSLAFQVSFTKKIVKELIPENLITHELDKIESGSSSNSTIIGRVLTLLEDGFKVSFYNYWEKMLSILTIMTGYLARSTVKYQISLYPKVLHLRRVTLVNLLDNLIKKCLELRQDTELQNPIDSFLKQATIAIGIENLANYAPLRIPTMETISDNTDTEGENLWLLSFYQGYLSHANLAYFYSDLIPLSDKLKQEGLKAKESNRPVAHKFFETLYHQIWFAFPSFCLHPRDIAEGFSLIADIIADYLLNEPGIRLYIATGICSLISKATVSFRAYERQSNEFLIEESVSKDLHSKCVEDLEVLSSCAEKFLPILFNIFIVHLNSELNQTIYKAIESFVSIAPHDVVNNFFREVVYKILVATTQKQDESNDNRHTVQLIHLSVVFIQFLSTENIQILFKAIEPEKSPKDLLLKKACYKALRSLTLYHPYYVLENLTYIVNLVSQSNHISSSKLHTIKNVLACMNSESIAQWMQGINSLISPLPVIVSGYRDTSTKTRKAATQCIEKLVEAIGLEALSNYLILLLAIDDPHLQSSTITIFTYLVKTYKRDNALNDLLLSNLIKTLIILLEIDNNEIKKSLLDLLKALVKPTSEAIWVQYLGVIVTTLLNFPEPVKSKFLTEIKVVLERFIVKIGYDKMKTFVPFQYQKMLNNIRKAYERSKKPNKQEKKSINNSDDKSKKFEKTDDGQYIFDESDSDDELGSNKKRKRGSIDDEDDGEVKTNWEDENWKNNVQQKKIKNVKRDGLSIALQTKESFKSARAGGDVKKEGRSDPYSYIPLDAKYLNKRRKFQASNQFKPFLNKKKSKK